MKCHKNSTSRVMSEYRFDKEFSSVIWCCVDWWIVTTYSEDSDLPVFVLIKSSWSGLKMEARRCSELPVTFQTFMALHKSSWIFKICFMVAPYVKWCRTLFIYQLTYTTLRNVELLKHSKIDKNAPSYTESETYAHLVLRDGGPVFRAPFCTYCTLKCIYGAPMLAAYKALNIRTLHQGWNRMINCIQSESPTMQTH